MPFANLIKTTFLTIVTLSAIQVNAQDQERFNEGAFASAAGALATVVSRTQLADIRRRYTVVDFDVNQGRAITELDRVRLVNRAEIGSTVRIDYLLNHEQSRAAVIGRLQNERRATQASIQHWTDLHNDPAADADIKVTAAATIPELQERLTSLDEAIAHQESLPATQVARLSRSTVLHVNQFDPGHMGDLLTDMRQQGHSLVRVERFTTEGARYLARFRGLGAAGIGTAAIGAYVMYNSSGENPEEEYVEENLEIIEDYEQPVAN